MSKTIAKKRKTRSDKFPLTLHPTGQYSKKIKGKLYYFGTDKREVLQRYLEDADKSIKFGGVLQATQKVLVKNSLIMANKSLQ